MKKQAALRKKGKPQTWVITALLAAIAIAYVVFVFLPNQRSIGKLRAQVQERRQHIIQAQTLATTVEQARLRLTETRAVGAKWQAQSPRQAELITHFASITQQAQGSGVAIERFDPLPVLERNRLAEQSVTLQFHAPFTAIFDFITRLEKLPGTMWIRSLRLHSAAADGGKLQGELTLTIFVDRTH